MNRARRFKKKELMVLVLILSLLLLSSNNFLNSTNNIQASNQEMNLLSFPYININEDSDFVDYGFQGNGTINDPYLIQDLILIDESPAGSSIHIQDTTKCFIISNNTITANNSNAIQLRNVVSGTVIISNNTIDFSHGFNTGIRILGSKNIRIENNFFYDCGYAFSLSYCEDIEINNNKIELCFTGLACVRANFIVFKNNLILSSTRGVFTTYLCSYISICNNFMDAHNGVTFLETTYSEISSNYIKAVQTETGIYFSESSNNFIYNNTIESAFIGIELKANSDNNVFNENTCSSSSQYNLLVESCDHITFTYNNFSQGGYQSVLFHFVSKIVFLNNDVIGAGYYGIYFATCSEVFMSQNYIARNEGAGIFCDNVDESAIIYNYIHENTGYGILFDLRSENNVVHHNEFYNNNIGGTSQACDHGKNNSWYDPVLQEGNLWMDYSGKGDYYIDGDARSVDMYPLGSDPTKTNNLSVSMEIIWFSISILTLYSAISRRKKYHKRML
ncbi:MAG: hypothetical protein GPJ51_11980 [Candidatus Heimdallarchaeota archaeon]|nr:hypothetical protein [Candidatus Heimdallarchaeota archaeon]